MNTEDLNIVVVICHDLGQHLGCYGQSDVRSPQIDALASSGVRFSNSFCSAPQCSPSRAGLWTGRFPHANGVVGLTHSGFANDLHDDETHLVQILREHGYDTHLFGIQHEARTAERCGYERIHDRGSCGEVASEFAKFVSQRKRAGHPLFAQIGFFEPHRPFPHEDIECLPKDSLTVPPWLPDIPEIREDLADIEASIHSADLAVGRIVEAIRASAIGDRTLIVFTADHGIAFPHAKMTLYDPGIEVALLMSGPGIQAGSVRDELISNVDVMPTLLDIVGIRIPDNLHGGSFAQLVSGPDSGGHFHPREAVFTEKTYHTYYDPMRSIRTNRWKLIANFEFAPWQETSPDYLNNAKSYVEVSKALNVPNDIQYHPPFELYDLENDPYEQSNLADDDSCRDTRDALIEALFTWMSRTEDPLLDGPIPQGAYVQRMEEFREIGTQRDASS